MTFALAPTCWGYLYKNESFSLFMFILLILGTILGAAGCVHNEFVNQEIDGKIKRTENRVFAKNQVQLNDLLIPGAITLILASFIMYFFNKTAIIITIITIVGTLLYPFAKRYIPTPQFVLAAIFPAGALVGYAMQNKPVIAVVPLVIYFCAFHWVATFDTIYAYQDYEDDLKHNVRSSATLLGYKYGKFALTYGWLKTCLLYHIFGSNYCLLAAIIFGLYMIYDLNLKDPASCKKWFLLQKYASLIFTVGVLGVL